MRGRSGQVVTTRAAASGARTDRAEMWMATTVERRMPPRPANSEPRRLALSARSPRAGSGARPSRSARSQSFRHRAACRSLSAWRWPSRHGRRRRDTCRAARRRAPERTLDRAAVPSSLHRGYAACHWAANQLRERAASARRKKLPSVTTRSPGFNPSTTWIMSPTGGPSFTARSVNLASSPSIGT